MKGKPDAAIKKALLNLSCFCKPIVIQQSLYDRPV